jgi:hypothetical protein
LTYRITLSCNEHLVQDATIPVLFLLLEVIGHADDYHPFLEEECAFEH